MLEKRGALETLWVPILAAEKCQECDYKCWTDAEMKVHCQAGRTFYRLNLDSGLINSDICSIANILD
jgi:hypothetical protein